MKTVSENRFLVQAQDVVALIYERLANAGAISEPLPTPEQLRIVLRRIEVMKRQIEDGSAPPRESRYRKLARILVDEWPLGHPLANKISELEDLYLNA
jgi:hypothetical protein